MARVKLSERQINEFKQQLVVAATRLFVRKGYSGVTMRGIAKELGCSPMKAYRYFGNKDEIFAMVRTQAYVSFGESQRNAYFSADQSVQRLIALGNAYYSYASEHPLQYRLMFELFQPDPEGYPELQQAETAAMIPLRTAVSELVDQHIFDDDVDLLTHVIWSSVHGVVSLNLAGKLRKRINPAAVEAALTTAIFRGLATN